MDPHPRKAFWRTLPHWDPLVMLQSWAIHPPWEAQSKIGIFIDLDAFWALRTMERPTAADVTGAMFHGFSLVDSPLVLKKAYRCRTKKLFEQTIPHQLLSIPSNIIPCIMICGAIFSPSQS
jgi:hypothetical protein